MNEVIDCVGILATEKKISVAQVELDSRPSGYMFTIWATKPRWEQRVSESNLGFTRAPEGRGFDSFVRVPIFFSVSRIHTVYHFIYRFIHFVF